MKSKLRHLMTSLYLGVGTLTLLLAPSIAFAGGWTGCGVGVGGSIVNGQIYDGPLAPIGISLQGEKGDVTGFCNYQTGPFVVGAGISYGLFYGDVKDAGIKDEWVGYGRIGLLTDKAENNLAYLHAGGTRISGSGNHANGYQLGIGDEFKIAGSPFTFDLRYSYKQLNPDDFGIPAGSGVKVNANEFRLGLNIAFYRDLPGVPLK